MPLATARVLPAFRRALDHRRFGLQSCGLFLQALGAVHHFGNSSFAFLFHCRGVILGRALRHASAILTRPLSGVSSLLTVAPHFRQPVAIAKTIQIHPDHAELSFVTRAYGRIRFDYADGRQNNR